MRPAQSQSQEIQNPCDPPPPTPTPRWRPATPAIAGLCIGWVLRLEPLPSPPQLAFFRGPGQTEWGTEKHRRLTQFAWVCGFPCKTWIIVGPHAPALLCMSPQSMSQPHMLHVLLHCLSPAPCPALSLEHKLHAGCVFSPFLFAADSPVLGTKWAFTSLRNE